MANEHLQPYLADTLHRATWEILETTIFMTPSAIEAVDKADSTFQEEVVALLGFTGTRAGTFVLRTSHHLAQTMTAKVQLTEANDDERVATACGEVLRALATSFKNAWEADGNQMELSVPNIVFHGRTSVDCSGTSHLRAQVQVALDDDRVEIGVHFEAQD